MSTTVTHNEHLPAFVDVASLAPKAGFATSDGKRCMLINGVQTTGPGAPGLAFDLDAGNSFSVSAGLQVDPLDLAITITDAAPAAG